VTGVWPILDMFRWMTGFLLIALGSLTVIGNLFGAVSATIKNEQFSLIPIVGGVSFSAGILVIPLSTIGGRVPYAAAALAADLSVISLICLPFYLALRRNRAGDAE